MADNTAQQQLPTTDQLFGAAPTTPQPSQQAPQQPGQLPTTDELFAPQKPSIASQIWNAPETFSKGVGEVGKSFFSDFMEAYKPDYGFSEETKADFVKSGIFNDHTKNEDNIWKSAAEAFITPVATGLEIAIGRPLSAIFAGTEAGLYKAGEEIGGPALGRDIALGLQAFPLGPRESIGIPHPVDVGVHNRATGSEGYYSGETPATPEQLRQENAAAAAVKPRYPGEPSEVPSDIHETARKIAPEVFNEYDALSQQRDNLREHLNSIPATREEAEAQAPHNDKIQELQAQLDGEKNKAEQRKLRAQIRDLTSQNEDAISVSMKSPESIEAARQQLQEIDYRIRDLAPAVSKAYRDAQEYVPGTEIHEVPKEAPKAAETEVKAIPTEGAAAEVGKVEPTLKVGGEAPKQNIDIAADVSKNLITAGRPAEEANAAAQLVAEHYKTRSERFNGTNGTPEEMYGRDMATIRAGRENAIKEKVRALAQVAGEEKLEAKMAEIEKRIDTEKLEPAQREALLNEMDELSNAAIKRYLPEKAKELEQSKRGSIRIATNDAKNVISLMKSANASTFIHEVGHHWLDELMRDAKDDKAPADLKKDADTVNKWLGVKEGEEIANRQHEKFARGFERYLMEGVAPSKQLANIFAKFKQWLTQIYETVSKLRSPITDDIRDVFDRLLSSKPEKTIIAPERNEGKIIENLHTEQAARTPPAKADAVGDHVAATIDRLTKTQAPEVYDALKKSEIENVSSEAASAATGSAGAEPTAGETNAPEQLGKVGGGGGKAKGESAGTRSEQPGNNFGIGTERTGRNARTEPAGPNSKFGESKADLIDKAGNIRLDLLNTPEDINQVLREMAQDNDSFTGQRRGVISNGLAMDLADAVGLDPSFIDYRKVGQAFNAEQIIASVKLMVQAAGEVRDLAKEGNIESYLEAKERLKMIQGHVSGVTAEAGRALQIFQSLKNIEGYDAAKSLGKFLKDEDNGKTLNQLEEEMNFAAKLQTTRQLSKFMQDSKKSNFSRYIEAYYINSLLSGPITHARYAVGNALMSIWEPIIRVPTKVLAGNVSDIAGLQREGGNRVYLGEAGAQLYAMGKGARDGLIAAINSYKTGEMPGMAGSLLNKKFAGEPLNSTFSKLIEQPVKIVQGIHGFFYTLRYEQNIAGASYRQALKEGLEGDSFTNRVTELTSSPPPEMIEDANKESLKELYMAPAKFNSVIGNLTRVTNNYLPAKIIVPFAKVGLNITKNAIEQTPIAPLLSKEVRANLSGANGAIARDTAVAKIVTGTALMGVTSAMVLEGMATGDGPEDPAQRATWMLTHKPNSLTVGDINIPYRGLGSLGMIMRFSANMTETAAHWGEEEGDKLAVAFLEGATKSVLDENFMLGVKNMLDAIYHPAEYAAHYIQSFATNWLPYSVGMSQTARMIDPYSREVRSHGMENAWGILDEAKAKTPYLSETLQPRMDMFGNPIKNGSTYEQYADDPVVQRLDALQIGVARLDRKITGVPLTDAQYADYSQLAGQMTKESLDNLVSLPGFDELPAAAQIEAIHKSVSRSRDFARRQIKMEYLGTDDDIVQKASDAREALFSR